MAYSFANFKTYLKIIFKRRDDLESIDSVNLYGIWTNAAYKDLTTKHRFWGLRYNFFFPQLEVSDTSQSTSDGVAYVDVPSDALIIRGVFDETSDLYLNRMPSIKSYRRKTDRGDTSAEGPPTEWIRSGDYIYLYQTPDATYSLEIFYKKVIAALTGTGETVIGTEWDDTILHLAAYKGFIWLGEYQKADVHKSLVMESMENLVGIYYEEEKDIKKTLQSDYRSKNYDFK